MPSLKPGLFLCLSFLLWPCLAQAALLRDDPALAKPVTVYIKGQGLDVIVAKLSEVSGVKLRARDAGLADIKAAVFVRDVPLHEVMNSLAQNFNLSWRVGNSQTDSSYDLRFSASYLKSRADYATNSMVLLEESVQRMIKTADEMTDEQIKQKQGELLGLIPKQGWQPELKQQLFYLLRMDDVHGRPYLALYRQLTDKQKQALSDGYDLYFDTNSPEPEWKLPANFPPACKGNMNISSFAEDPTKPPRRIGTYARITLGRDDRGFRLGGAVADYDKDSHIAYVSVNIAAASPADYYENTTLRYTIKVEGKPFDQKVKITRQEVADEAGIRWQDRTASVVWMNKCDILGILHKKTGIPIISDYYQNWFSDWDKWEATVADILSGLWRLNDTDRCWVNWNGRVLCARTDEPFMMDLRTISDGVLRPWQQKYLKDGQLGLDDFSDIVRLPDDQLSTMRRSGQFLGVQWLEDVPELSQYSTALNINRVLTPAQRTYALKHELQFESLSDTQKQTLSKLMFVPSFARTGPRHGIYENDRRIDGPTLLPQNANRSLPAGIKIKVEKATDYSFGYLKQRPQKTQVNPGIERKSFPTLKEAWENALKLNPKATKQDLERRDTTTHIFTLREADGRIHDETFPINRFTPYAKLKDEEKLPETKAPD